MKINTVLLACFFVLISSSYLAEYWPIAKPDIEFETALGLAKAELQKQHETHEQIRNMHLQNFILVSVIYGTDTKAFNSVMSISPQEARRKGNWGWTFVFADYNDASLSAKVRVTGRDRVQLLDVTV